MSSSLVFVRGDDWEGLYVHGVLMAETHHLHWKHVLDALLIPFEVRHASESWLEDRGTLPVDLKDVVSL